MATDTAPSPPKGLFGQIVDKSKELISQFIAYVNTVGLLVTALTTVVGLIFVLREKTGLGTLGFRVILALALLPLAAAMASIVMPEVVKWWRRRKVLTIDPKRSDYFQTSPRDRPDTDGFSRADNAHLRVLEWLKEPAEPILILTGRSGTGKSSLLDAFVLPKLRAETPPVLTVSIRSYDDPVAELRQELFDSEAFAGTARPGASISTRKLIERACERLAASGRRLLLVFDQFEELVIIHGETPDRVQPLRELLTSLHDDPIAGLTILLSLRDDYKGRLGDLGLPLLDQKTNWKSVEPFSEPDTIEFLRGGFQEIGDQRLRNLMDELRTVEETRGLIRPIVANLAGLILWRESSLLARPDAPGSLLSGYVRRCIERSDVRDLSRQILKPMLTRDGTKHPRSVRQLKDTCHLDERIIEDYLLGLNAMGLVRPINAPASVLDRIWEISHDFVADLIDQILNHPRRSPWQALRPWLLPASLLLWLVAFAAGLPFLAEYQQAEAIRQLADLGCEIHQLRDEKGQPVNDHLGHPIVFVSAPEFKDPRGLERISPLLQKLSNLSRLTLSGYGVTDLKPLAGLTQVQSLGLLWTGVTDFKPLVALTQLQSLDLSGANVTDLKPLAALTQLQSLDLSGTGVTDLKPLAGLTQLRQLDLQFSDVTDLKPLAALTQLQSLDLSGTGVTDLKPLAGLTQLQRLDLYVTGMTDLKPLAGLTQLRQLDLGKDGETDLKSLATLTQIQSLVISGAGETDLKPLAGLTQLQSLDLSKTYVTDLKPLAGLTQLRQLDLLDSPDLRQQGESLKKSLPNLSLKFH